MTGRAPKLPRADSPWDFRFPDHPDRASAARSRLFWVTDKPRLVEVVSSGCPLSGAVFVVIADPLIRYLHQRLHGPKAGMVLRLADDMGIVLRSARFLEMLRPMLDHIALVSGLRCQVAPLVAKPNAADLACLHDCQRRASPAWQAVQVVQVGTYLGVFLGSLSALSCVDAPPPARGLDVDAEEEDERGRVRRRRWFSERFAFAQAFCGRLGADHRPVALAFCDALQEDIDEFRCFALAVAEEINEEID